MALARLSLSRRPPALVRSNQKTPHDLHTASFTAYMTLRPSSARYDLFSKVEKEKKLRKKISIPSLSKTSQGNSRSVWFQSIHSETFRIRM